MFELILKYFTLEISQIDYPMLKIFTTLVVLKALDVGQWTTADDSADFF